MDTIFGNTGMFMFNSEFMKTQYRMYANDTYKILTSLPDITSSNYKEELEKKYAMCEAISIDFAIMEKTDKLFVIPSDFGWDDVGSWMSIERYLVKDESGNIIKGEVKAENSKNNTVFTTTKPVVLFCSMLKDCLLSKQKKQLLWERETL